MRKIISFMHISLGGFVAGPNGEMDLCEPACRQAGLREQMKMN